MILNSTVILIRHISLGLRNLPQTEAAGLATLMLPPNPNHPGAQMATLSMSLRTLAPILVRLKLAVRRSSQVGRVPGLHVPQLILHHGRRRTAIRITGQSGRTTPGGTAAGGACIGSSLET